MTATAKPAGRKSAWPARTGNGAGFEVVLPPDLAVSGRIVRVTLREAPADTGDEDNG